MAAMKGHSSIVELLLIEGVSLTAEAAVSSVTYLLRYSFHHTYAEWKNSFSDSTGGEASRNNDNHPGGKIKGNNYY